MTATHRRSAIPPLLIIGFLVFACAAIMLFLNLSLSFPAQAAELVGPPRPGLSLLHKFRLSYTIVMNQERLLQPTQPGGADVEFTIAPGDSTENILQRLEQSNLIPNGAVLRAYLIYAGLDTNLQSGSHTLSGGMSPIQIAALLQDSTPQEVAFGILPGWRMEEIALSLPTSGLAITAEEFLAAAWTRPAAAPIIAELPYGVSLEGFFFPGIYQVPRAASAADLVLLLLNNFSTQVTPDLRAAYQSSGLSLHNAVILASIVEREAVVDDEKPLIASVFLNRYRIGMKLDADPTVQYAAGFNAAQNTWWSNPLTVNDLAFDSPYNTYLYSSLPPAPIANPDLASLTAIAFPAASDYLYFRAACDGSGRHLFAYTLEEHYANACH